MKNKIDKFQASFESYFYNGDKSILLENKLVPEDFGFNIDVEIMEAEEKYAKSIGDFLEYFCGPVEISEKFYPSCGGYEYVGVVQIKSEDQQQVVEEMKRKFPRVEFKLNDDGKVSF